MSAIAVVNDAMCLAIQTHERADAELSEAIKTAYPIGAKVSWERGGNRVFGVVIYHLDFNPFFEVKVRNTSTGSEYRQSAGSPYSTLRRVE